MALVTVQRSPSSVTGSPQCSNSDGEADEDDVDGGKYERSECFFAGKGTALVLALKDIPQYAERRLSTDSTRSTNSTQSNNSDIQQHLQSMFNLLRHEETLKMAVKLESQRPNRTRYLVIASRCCLRNGSEKRSRTTSRCQSKCGKQQINDAKTHEHHLNSQHQNQGSNENKQHQQQQQQQQEMNPPSDADILSDKRRAAMSNQLLSTNRCSKSDSDKYESCAENIEESCLLGIDCNENTTIGLVVPILADTTIHLDGDGGFSVSVFGKTHIFKPVSVQAMWSALQTLHKVSQKARENNFYPGGPSHDWLSNYERRVESEQSCLNEWNAMDSIESRRPPSPDAIRNKPREKDETQRVIKMKLKEIMMSVDLDEVTSKYIRGRLEDQLDMDLGEYKSFIDEEMLIILGQMDAPTEIFEHVYLGSEWNASNLEELQRNGVRHILNVTREIDNFFPGMFDYFNVRVYDDEKTNLLKHWDNTFKYITRAKAEGSKVLVHCKMGVSRSASVVIAYAMKAYNWEFHHALQHVKERRSCIKPNKNFLSQLETYRGMLDAMKNKEKLQRSKSETNLKSTKDARLLPGSEPTPLIQALNQSKKSANEKQRKLLRRSSSTSPKSIQSAIVVKQQSQSLENLTPERSVADEPKNVRFPGSNGENYSVTQNQVLHIQKNTPTTSVKTIIDGLESNDKKTADDRKNLNLQIGRSISVEGGGGSVASRVVGNSADNTTTDDMQISSKNLGSPVWTSSAKLITQTSNIQSSSTLNDAGASSTRVIHRNSGRHLHRRETGDLFSSHVDNVFEKEEPRQTRKTHSWAPNSVIIDPCISSSRQSSNSSVDSAVVLGYPGERRELPSRHSSWGSGDNRVLPSRNSSWGSYDTNRNTFHHSAIFEGQIQNQPNKTAKKDDIACNTGTVKRTKQKLEECTVLKKRCQDNTKQQQQNAATPTTNSTTQTPPMTMTTTITTTSGSIMLNPPTSSTSANRSLSSSSCSSNSKRNSNLFRSQSATSRQRYHPNRCNSEEIILSDDGGGGCVGVGGGTDGRQELSASAPDSYTMSSDMESVVSDVSNRSPTDAKDDSSTTADEKISGNVQTLKKSFEAKATGTGPIKGQSLPSSPVAQHSCDHATSDQDAITTSTTAAASASDNPLTSSLVVETLAAITTTSSSPSSSSHTTSSTNVITRESKDRNVKGLVNKYQSSRSHSNPHHHHHHQHQHTPSSITPSPAISTAHHGSGGGGGGSGGGSTLPYKARPRSYYENRSYCSSATATMTATATTNPHHHSSSIGGGSGGGGGKVHHDYTNARPPVPPLTRNHTTHTDTTTPTHHTTMTESILTQNLSCNYRRVQQHGKTHPLARLSLPKQRFNAAAYNTM
ncbi:protein phosphatase Slingshot [Episyrphus balteatus]|uniref:protein phosphatase Slingshot n=1 Tax=Episyrphus balteatus TaxID=286459 RepID=UPI002486BFB2|nr:protein phosphatase Slingshot [Episyrphus balteatus]